MGRKRTFLAQIEESAYVSSEDQVQVSGKLAEKMSLLSTALSVQSSESGQTVYYTASVEKVEDEDQITQRLKPKAQGTSTLEETEESFDTEFLAAKAKVSQSNNLESRTENIPGNLEPPAANLTPVKVPKRKKAAPGRAAVGTSVLLIRGHVNRMVRMYL